ncbi:MAG: tetratricopeptide repeat protein, partial [Candidatus Obscuribacterales bacterium]
AKAEPLIIAAKSTLEKTEGSQSHATASLLDNLATLYTRTNRLTEAEDLQRRAIVIIEKYHGHFSADTAISMNNLATTYSLEGKHDEAKRTSLEACAIAQKALGPNHPYTRRCLRVLDGILGKGLKQEPGAAPTPTTSQAPQ